MAEYELEILQGTVGAVVFQNYDNGYAVLRLKCPDGQTVTHTPGIKTLHLYFEGDAVLEDHTLKCLVNTIDSISYVKYIKLYYNGAPVSIEGNCPEEGFINFNVNTSE